MFNNLTIINNFKLKFDSTFFNISLGLLGFFIFNKIQFLNFYTHNNFQLLFILIFTLPLLLSIGAYFINRFGLITLIIISYTFLITIIQTLLFIFLAENKTYTVLFGNWVNLSTLNIKWEFVIDSLSLLMLLIVSIITFCVLLYSIGYLYEDPHLLRFLFYIGLFSFFMVTLVSANNFLVLFLGWEGVGICSYLLISFWFTRLKAVKAALKAVVMNRIGDTGMLIGIVLSYAYFQTIDFSDLLYLTSVSNISEMHTLVCHLLCFYLFLGVIGKSAQLGLHTWLLLAMEGPTPASALIHAATMVTAGIFLVIRLSPIFNNAPGILILITFVGSLTALFAGICALVQTDMKRIVAFSTTSQLGYMLLTCGLSQYSLAFFHLINHAFFKAMLFMTMGIIIHILSNEQDLRRAGGLLTILPLIYTALQIGNSSLTGFIFTNGFFSKDLIIEIAFLQHTFFIDSVVQQIVLITAVLTFLYSSRVIYYLFLNSTQLVQRTMLHFANNASYIFLTIALIPLLILSIIFGFFARNWFIGSQNIFENSVYSYTLGSLNQYVAPIVSETLPVIIKMLPAFLCIFFSFVLLLNMKPLLKSFYNQFLNFTKSEQKLHNFLNKTQHFLYYKWYSDKIFDKLFSLVLHSGQTYVIEPLERGIFDYFQITSSVSVKTISKNLNKYIIALETVNPQVYLGFIILTIFLILVII